MNELFGVTFLFTAIIFASATPVSTERASIPNPAIQAFNRPRKYIPQITSHLNFLPKTHDVATPSCLVYCIQSGIAKTRKWHNRQSKSTPKETR